MWMFVHLTQLVLLSATLSNEIFCGSFWSKNRFFVCVPATKAKWILFLNHRNRKVARGTHNVLVHYVDDCAPNLSGVVLCNHFIWNILLFISGCKSCCFFPSHNSKMNFKTYQYLPVGVCFIETPTNHLLLLRKLKKLVCVAVISIC